MMQRHRTNLISRATVLLASLVALAAAPGEAAVILSGDTVEEEAVTAIGPLDRSGDPDVPVRPKS